MSRRVLLAFALVSLPLVAWGSSPPQLVVLRFNGKGVAEAVLESATERAASAALRRARGRLKVVTRDMLAAIVGEERLARCEAEARCELDLGTGLGTGYVLAGSMRGVEGRWEVAVKLYDVRKLDLLAHATAATHGVREALDGVDALVAQVFAQALLAPAAASEPFREGTIEEVPRPASLAADAELVAVAFESDPAGATVRVDDQLLCKETPCRKRLAPGPHHAVFEKERHDPAAQTFTAAKGASVRGALAPRFGWVSVATVPSGLGVAIDGVDVGTSPVKAHEVNAGGAEIVVSDPCWLRTGERVAVNAGERRSVELRAKPRIAGLRVDAEDAKGNAVDAAVSVDGVAAGMAGDTLQVALCARNVAVRLGGETFESPLKLEEGKVAVVTARPRASAPAAAAPAWAAPPGGQSRAQPLAVLDFTGQLDPDARARLTDDVRYVSANAVQGMEWVFVMTRESQDLIMRVAGRSTAGDPIATGRAMEASFVVSGDIHQAGGRLILSLKLWDTRSGALVAAQRATARDVERLRDEARRTGAALFR